ncbi:MAG: hypothetical protein ACOZAK_04365 [Patescibacteria group bacterium]
MINKKLIKKLTEEILKFREARNWKQYHSPKNMAISFYIETAELAEYFQYGFDEVFEQTKKYQQKVADEIIDVLWWTLLIAYEYSIELNKNKATKSKNIFKPRNSLMRIFNSIGKISNELIKSQDIIKKKYKTKNPKILEKELQNIFNQVVSFAKFINMDIEKEFYRKLDKNKKRYPIKKASFLKVFSVKLYKNI